MKIKITYILLFFFSNLYCFGSPESFSEEENPIPEKTLIQDQSSKIDESSFWENSKTEDKVEFSDDDAKLYAPPPGGNNNGNPQKLVTPLGNSEITVFLLMALFAGIFFSVKLNSLKKKIR